MTLTSVSAASIRTARPYIPVSLRAGTVGLTLLVVLAAAAPWIAPYDPTEQNIADLLQGPSMHHLLGTDNLGRDVMSRLLFGARVDLLLAVAVLVVPFLVGTVVGTIAGYQGGWIDATIMRITDVVTAFPFYVLVIAIVFSLGSGLTSLFIAFSLVAWVSYARLIRGGMQGVKRLEYADAATVGGLSPTRIAVRHLLPNVITQAFVYAMSDVVLTILAIVTLGFLGLGVQPPTPDWGGMIADGQQFLTQNPWMAIAPGAAVVITGLFLSMIADGLADFLDAR